MIALIAAAVAAGVWGTIPGVRRAAAMVLPRFVDPLGDHRPFTRVRFEVNASPLPVPWGQPATLTATLDAPWPIASADVVFVDDRGHVAQRLPMLATHRPPRPHRDASQSSDDFDNTSRFTLRLASVESQGRFYIDTPHGRSEYHTLPIDTTPRIERVDITYHPPRYTGWPDRTEPLTARGLSALAGTLATLTIRTSAPVTGGVLQLQPDATHAAGFSASYAASPNPRVGTVTFPIKRDGQFTLRLAGLGIVSDGADAADAAAEAIETARGPVRALADAPPHHPLHQPRAHHLCTPGLAGAGGGRGGGRRLGGESTVEHINR